MPQAGGWGVVGGWLLGCGYISCRTVPCLTPPPTHPHTRLRTQLIVHLGVPADDPSAPDWGTIAVYSCAASCASGVTAGTTSADESAYMEEFVWVQESA